MSSVKVLVVVLVLMLLMIVAVNSVLNPHDLGPVGENLNKISQDIEERRDHYTGKHEEETWEEKKARWQNRSLNDSDR